MLYNTTHNSTSKTWNGLSSYEPIYNPKGSVGNAILNALARCPNKIGQISDNNGVQLTNREIRLKSIRTAEHLLKLGFKKGDLFAFVGQNNHNLVPLVFGSIIIGGITSHLDGTFKDAELSHFIRNSTPAIIFCDNAIVDRMRKISTALDMSPMLITIDDGQVDGVKSVSELFSETGTESTFRCPDISDSAATIAAIITTSGTTGLPKGACLSHANILAAACLANYTTDDVILTTTNISWISAFKALVTGTLSNSLRIITTEFCTPELILNMIEKYGVTNVSLSPTSLALILQALSIKTTNLSSLKSVVSGGSSIYMELIQWFKKIFPVTTKFSIVYGMTEASGALAFNTDNTDLAKCVGYLAPNSCVKIVNELEERCGVNEIGDVRYKMMYPFLGYYGEDQLTKDVFDQDGFIQSGDIGYFDNCGRLFLVDRKKEMLIYDCNHVSPVEIESVIITHPGVLEVCVIGKPDLTHSELPTAVIVKKPGIDVVEKEIEDLVKEKMFEWKHLYGGVYFVNELPKTQRGKIIRRIVKDLVAKIDEDRKHGGLK